MLNECQTENDQFSLIDNILLNFEIWIKAEINELQQIVQHICNDLFEACTSYFVTDSFFNKVFGIVRIYFTSEGSQSPSINGQQNPNFDSTIFISYFDALMLKRAKLLLTANDIEIYLSTILMSHDKQFVEHLLF